MSTTKLERATAIHLLFALATGVVAFAAAAIGGEPALGIALFGIMLAYGLIATVVARRTETGQAMFGRRDERAVGLDLRATAISGLAMAVVVVVAAFVDPARGGNGQPYAAVAAIGGLAYLIAFLLLNRRS
jgi:hypothetical protein